MSMPADSFSDDELHRFLDQAVDEDATNELEAQMIRDDMAEKFREASDIANYVLPIAGSDRYEAEREARKASMLKALQTDMQRDAEDYEEDGFENAMRDMIDDAAKAEASAQFFTEIYATEMAIEAMVRLETLSQQVNVSDAYYDVTKKRVLADVIFVLGIHRNDPVIGAIMYALPGPFVNLLSSEMDPYYQSSQLRADQSVEIQKHVATVHQAELAIALRSPHITLQELSLIEHIAWTIADAARAIYADNDTSFDSRRDMVENLIETSPLGYETTTELIEYARTHKMY